MSHFDTSKDSLHKGCDIELELSFADGLRQMTEESRQKTITPRQVHSRMYHLTPRTFKDNKDNLSPFTDNFPGG